MAGQKRRKVRFHTNRAHARTAAAVWNRKSFVQVQMRNDRTEFARFGQPDLRIHVRAVHVHLPTELMHDVANFHNILLEYAVRGRIRHHQARQVVGMLLGFGA